MKAYGQYCGVARGLDLVGDRWSLLIIRELALGDRRYGALQRGLPGIATNLLTDRLRDLIAAGLVARRTGEGRTSPYGLTTRGRALLPTLFELVRWATPDMVSGPQPTDAEQPAWVAFAALAYLRDAPPSVSLRIVLACDGVPIRIAGHDGTVTVALGDDPEAGIRIEANSWALMALVSGSLGLVDLRRVDPGATVHGTRAAQRSLEQLVAHQRG